MLAADELQRRARRAAIAAEGVELGEHQARRGAYVVRQAGVAGAGVAAAAVAAVTAAAGNTAATARDMNKLRTCASIDHADHWLRLGFGFSLFAWICDVYRRAASIVGTEGNSGTTRDVTWAVRRE
jgi:hypothetical protein